jgi:hypothetical protein
MIRGGAVGLPMTRFPEFLDGREPTGALLRQYLKTRGEWVAREFKRADQASDFGLRIAVAAFANTDGGDVFLGVDDDAVPQGTPVDPADVSRILGQSGAPTKDGYLTNLVGVVRDPRWIPLADGPPVCWIDVVAQGMLVGIVKSDGALGLYIRPGAESDEVRGFGAIDIFRRKTRARLLVRLFSETRRAIRAIPVDYIGPGHFRSDMIRPVLMIIESPEWLECATDTDRSLTNSSYLGPLLNFPGDSERWEQLPWQDRGNQWRMRTMCSFDGSLRALRAYIEQQHIVLPPKDDKGY